MNEMLNWTSSDFWFGIVGAFFVTGFLTQVLKWIINKIIPGEDIAEGWKYVIAVPAGFVVAVCFQLHQIAEANHALEAGASPMLFNWGTIPALTIIYAAASAYVYRFAIKKLFPSNGDKS